MPSAAGCTTEAPASNFTEARLEWTSADGNFYVVRNDIPPGSMRDAEPAFQCREADIIAKKPKQKDLKPMHVYIWDRGRRVSEISITFPLKIEFHCTKPAGPCIWWTVAKGKCKDEKHIASLTDICIARYNMVGISAANGRRKNLPIDFFALRNVGNKGENMEAKITNWKGAIRSNASSSPHQRRRATKNGRKSFFDFRTNPEPEGDNVNRLLQSPDNPARLDIRSLRLHDGVSRWPAFH